MIPLILLAFLAGFIDAMVGGGGLIQLPAMFIFMPHLGLAQTLGTNKFAALLGTTVSARQYFKKVSISWSSIAPSIITAFVFSFCGALLVSFFKKEDFLPFIITALILVWIYTFIKKDLGIEDNSHGLSVKRGMWLGIISGGIIGFYDGLIGPGAGSFLIFVYVFLFGYDFLKASASAKLVNVATNLSALLFFIFNGSVVYEIAIPVALANISGAYLGSRLAIKKGSAFVRIIFLIVVGILIGKMIFDFYKAY